MGEYLRIVEREEGVRWDGTVTFIISAVTVLFMRNTSSRSASKRRH